MRELSCCPIEQTADHTSAIEPIVPPTILDPARVAEVARDSADPARVEIVPRFAMRDGDSRRQL